MDALEKTITLEEEKSRKKEYRAKIIPFGDIHMGAAGVNKLYLKKTIDWIEETPNCWAIGIGDNIDAIDIKDKRFDIKSVDKDFIKYLDDIAGAQMEYMVDLLEPIKEKILVMLPGNHEDKLRTRYSIDVMKQLKDDLGVSIGSDETYLRLKFNRNQFHVTPVTFWLHHGWFAGRKMGGKINQLTDVSNSREADVYIAGHSHDLWATTLEKQFLPLGGMTPIKIKKIFINSGTFMETNTLGGTSYSSQKAYPISKIGTARLDIYPNHRPRPDLHVRI